MAKIGVIHPDLMAKGGAEGVCMAALESLQPEHQLTLLTLTGPDFGSLNRYFNTSIDEDSLTVRRFDSPSISAVSRLSAATVRTVGFSLSRLRTARFYQLCKANGTDYDLLVSTFNELGPVSGSVQYIHHPLFDRRGLLNNPNKESRIHQGYDTLCASLLGLNGTVATECDLLVANSDWTAGVFNSVYGVTPSTLYPPVETGDLAQDPWEEREDGFVTVGRLTPEKNLPTTIEIVVRLQKRGHDVHQHIVGPPSHPEVSRDVQQAADKHEFIHYEGAIERKELTALLASHRYGLHGKQYEQFGIAVAEMVASGMVPLVPDSGGQREVVDEQESVLYRSPDEAVEKLDALLSDSSLVARVREELPEIEERFGRKRFREAFSETVSEALG